MKRNWLGILVMAATMASFGGVEALKDMPWIGDGRPELKNDADFYKEECAPRFRAEFVLPQDALKNGEPKVHVACAGYYSLWVNGQLVPGQLGLDQLWTPFDHTIYANLFTFPKGTFKPYPAKNEIQLLLGNGFYNLPPLRFWGGKNFRAALAHGRPCFKLTIDGVEAPLEWKWRESYLVKNCVYLGAEIDRSREEKEFTRPAANVKGPKGQILPQRAPQVRAIGHLVGKSRWLKEGSVQVVDFGVNASGVTRFIFDGPHQPGQRIEVLFGERLNKDGSVNVLTQTAGQIKAGRCKGGPGAPATAAQRDVLICRGIGRECLSSEFAWHICRYAEIRGWNKLLGTNATDGRPEAEMSVVSSQVQDSELAAKFQPAKPEFAKLHEICRRTFRANLIGVQSDCPGRERLGYGGDIAATFEALMLNYDMREFYLKVLQDFADEASGDGWLTETAPHVGIADGGFGGRSGPVAWAVGVPLVMDGLIRHYPDIQARVLAYYPVCSRYVRLVAAKCPSGIIPRCIGDHEALERAPNDLNATAHWYKFVTLTAKFAKLLGKADEVKEFNAIAATIKKAFATKWVKADGTVANGTQSAQALALYMGLVPDALIPAAEAKLVAAVEVKGCAPYTGIYSTRYMLMYLSEHGRRDLAEKIVLHQGFPGWLHMLDQGATTLWETWRESDNTFSNCHPMFGSVDEWILLYGGK